MRLFSYLRLSWVLRFDKLLWFIRSGMVSKGVSVDGQNDNSPHTICSSVRVVVFPWYCNLSAVVDSGILCNRWSLSTFTSSTWIVLFSGFDQCYEGSNVYCHWFVPWPYFEWLFIWIMSLSLYHVCSRVTIGFRLPIFLESPPSYVTLRPIFHLPPPFLP